MQNRRRDPPGEPLLPFSTSYPKAPIVVATTGHLLANPSATFTRVPAPTLMGTIMADQEAISSPGSSSQPSPTMSGPSFVKWPSLPRPTKPKLRTREFALDHRPHITDEPLGPVLIGHECAIPDETNPWHL